MNLREFLASLVRRQPRSIDAVREDAKDVVDSTRAFAEQTREDERKLRQEATLRAVDIQIDVTRGSR